MLTFDMRTSQGLVVVDNRPGSEVDVIFILGLTGTRSEVWSTNWISQQFGLLPTSNTIPNARIMTFGYDARNILHTSSRYKAQVARRMSLEILEAREHAVEERPLIFVALNEEGLVTHEALLSTLVSSAIMPLNASTVGLIFIGIRGSMSAQNQSTSKQHIVAAESHISNFKVSSNDGVEGFSHSFSISADGRGDDGPEVEAVSLYGRTNFKYLLDEAPRFTRRPAAEKRTRYLFDSEDQATSYISDKMCEIVRRTIRVLGSQINPVDNDAASACSKKSHCDRIIEWFSQSVRVGHQNIWKQWRDIERRETGSWLLERPEFTSWIQNDSCSLFWLKGSSGAGKSVLVSYVLQDLQKRLDGVDGSTIAYYFCDARYKMSTPAAMVLREIIKELLRRHSEPTTLERLQAILAVLESGDSKISSSQLRCYFTAIQRTLADGETLFLIIDGLDEADESETRLLEELISLAHQNLSSHIKCFVSGRLSWNRNGILERGVTVNIDENARTRRDLASFINYEVESLLQVRSYGETLYKKLSANPESVFSRAVLALRNLGQIRASNTAEIQSFIDSIPPTLAGTYQYMLSSISERDRDKARKLLTIVAYAARPLQISELLNVMDLDMREVYLNSRRGSSTVRVAENHRSSERDILRLSGGLVTLDKDGTVNFVHYSARDYLISQGSEAELRSLCFNQNQAHEMLTRICLYFLHPHRLNSSLDSSRRDNELDHAASCQSFGNYAIQFWSFHYKIAEQQSDSLPGLLQQLIKESLFFYRCEICQVVGISSEITAKDFTNAALHIATQVGSEKIARMLLEMGADPNITTDYDGTTLLHSAAKMGYLELVKTLVDWGACVDPLTAAFERTPLYYASAGGHIAIMKLLLLPRRAVSDRSSNVDQRGRSALCTAWDIYGLNRHYATFTQAAIHKDAQHSLSYTSQQPSGIQSRGTRMSEQIGKLSEVLLATWQDEIDNYYQDQHIELKNRHCKGPYHAQPQQPNKLAALELLAREALIQGLLESGSDGVWKYSDKWGLEGPRINSSPEPKRDVTMTIVLALRTGCGIKRARTWGKALEVAVERGQEESIRFLLEHEAVLPAKVALTFI